MPERLSFPESYNAVSVPETIVMPDEENEQLTDTTEHFFEEVKQSLQISHLAVMSFCRVRFRAVVPSVDVVQFPPIRTPIADEYISELDFEGLQPLATVLRSRDDWGRRVACFAKYPLLPRTIETIREFDVVDGIITDPPRE